MLWAYEFYLLKFIEDDIEHFVKTNLTTDIHLGKCNSQDKAANPWAGKRAEIEF